MAKFANVDEYMASHAEPMREIAEKVRTIIDGIIPPETCAIWHSHPVWSLGSAPGKGAVCLLKVHTAYVTFGFWKGRDISDPSGRLDLSGSMAHVKLRSIADIDTALFSDWLHQARELEESALAKES